MRNRDVLSLVSRILDLADTADSRSSECAIESLRHWNEGRAIAYRHCADMLLDRFTRLDMGSAHDYAD